LQKDLLEIGAEAGEGTAGRFPLDGHTIGDHTAHGFPLDVVLTFELGEAPVVGDVDFLATGEFELGATAPLDGVLNLVILAADGDQDLTDVAPGSLTVGTTERTTHTGLKPIRTSATQHLVDAKHVEGVGAHADVEVILTGGVDHVLVHRNTGGLQSLGGDLLVLVGDHMHGGGVDIGGNLLATGIEDPDLRIRDTSAKTRLGVRLVLTVAVALVRTTTHFVGLVV